MRPRAEILRTRANARTYKYQDAYPEPRLTKYVRGKHDADNIVATELIGDYPRSLRKLSLIQTRHQISHLIERPDLDQKYVDVADQIRLNAIYRKTFQDDHYANYNARQIVELMGTPEQLKFNAEPFVFEYARTINTTANKKLNRIIDEPRVKMVLKEMKTQIKNALKTLKPDLTIVNFDRHTFENAERTVMTIAHILKYYSDMANNKTNNAHPRSTLIEHNISDKWCELRPTYPTLERSHNGRMNRKRRPFECGKTPKYLSRLLTDESKRIFAKKSKSLGGTVVIDISGSMSLSEYEIEKMVMSASGSTVWCYSATCNGLESENMWLVAHNGKRVRTMPAGNGGNGVDLPALAFAYSRKRRRKDLMIWVSDGQVTGRSGEYTRNLRRATAKFVRQKEIHHVYHVEQAIELLAKAQQNHLPKRVVTEWEKKALTANQTP